MAYLNYPLLGDTVYGGRAHIPAGVDAALRQVIQDFKRQALHAERLSFEHPRSREMVSFAAPLPDDFQHLLDALIQYD
jgi:23S rRNA pseudouridine1911/1915/1917 synthase